MLIIFAQQRGNTVAKMECKTGISKDRRYVNLEFVVGGRSTGPGNVEAPDIDGLILLLSRLRAGLADKVPDELDPGSNPLAIQNPAWRELPVRLPTGHALDLRHPGFGWIRFVFPPEQAAQIADYLKRDLPIEKAAP